MSLITCLSLNAAVRPHSADWDEAQAAESVTQVMFPSFPVRLFQFGEFLKFFNEENVTNMSEMSSRAISEICGA